MVVVTWCLVHNDVIGGGVVMVVVGRVGGGRDRGGEGGRGGPAHTVLQGYGEAALQKYLIIMSVSFIYLVFCFVYEMLSYYHINDLIV